VRWRWDLDYDNVNGVFTNDDFRQMPPDEEYTAGVHWIALFVSDGYLTESLLIKRSLEVTDNISPVASFTFDPVAGDNDLLVTFDASATKDDDFCPEGDTGGSTSNCFLKYKWDFGDVSPLSNVGPHTTHTYTTPQTNPYTITLTVTDQNGQYVSGLRAEDFMLYEGDLSQPITYFNTGQQEPVSLGFLVDMSESMHGKRRRAVQALRKFVLAIRPRDEVFLVGFNQLLRKQAPLGGLVLADQA